MIANHVLLLIWVLFSFPFISKYVAKFVPYLQWFLSSGITTQIPQFSYYLALLRFFHTGDTDNTDSYDRCWECL